MTDDSMLDFDDLAPVSIGVKYQGVKYTLREATEAATSSWECHRFNNRQYDSNGRVIALKDDFALSDSLLLSQCLFHEDGSRVNQSIIREWPTRVTEPLIKRLKEISGIDQSDDLETLEKELAIIQRKIVQLKRKAAIAAMSQRPPDEANGDNCIAKETEYRGVSYDPLVSGSVRGLVSSPSAES